MTSERSESALSSRDQVEQRVDAEIERLADAEEITVLDLERFRRALPTDPLLARAVSKALPWPLSELYEFVEGSERQAAYWRVSPDRSRPRSAADRAHRERFAKAACRTQVVPGTKEYQGREIPNSAAIVAEQVGTDLPETGQPESSGDLALQRLRELLLLSRTERG